MLALKIRNSYVAKSNSRFLALGIASASVLASCTASRDEIKEQAQFAAPIIVPTEAMGDPLKMSIRDLAIGSASYLLIRNLEYNMEYSYQAVSEDADGRVRVGFRPVELGAAESVWIEMDIRVNEGS